MTVTRPQPPGPIAKRFSAIALAFRVLRLRLLDLTERRK